MLWFKQSIVLKIVYTLLLLNILLSYAKAEVIGGYGCYIEGTLCVPLHPNRDDYIKDEILLSLSSDTPEFIYKSLLKNFNLDESESIDLLGHELKVAKTNGRDPLELSRELNRTYYKLGASTNNIYEYSGTVFKIISKVEKDTYPKSLTGARKALSISNGSGVLIGMIDGPVDVRHKSLRGKVRQINLVGVNSLSVANLLHGSAVAGVLVSSNPQIGIAPGASLLSIAAFKHTNNKFGSSSSLVAKAIVIAMKNKVDVLNLSFSGGYDKVVERMVNKAIHSGIIVVASCGNNSSGKPRYPAAIQDVLAVTAVDHLKRTYKKANYGRYIDVAAPGVGVLTTAPGNRYQLSSGTSLAAANVTGSLALLLSKNRKIDRYILNYTAIDLGLPGHDNTYGDGLINVYNALRSSGN